VPSRTVKAARFMVLSALGFALMGACVKVLGLRNFPVLEIIAFRAAISLILSLAFVLRKGIPIFGQQRLWLLARGVVGFLALLCVYYSVVHLPLAEATILQYVHPIFTLLIALLFLGERIHSRTVVCIALSLAGLVLVAQPSSLAGAQTNTLDPFTVGIALLGALGSGTAYVIVRKLATTEDSSVIILYFPLVCLPATIVLGWQNFALPAGSDWFYVLGVGLFTQVGQWGLTKGMALQSAGIVSAFSYIQVPFAMLLGYLVFNESVNYWVIGGATLILLAAWINTQTKTEKSA
jgi:drug/metabolite transporter (DMT)-like permease